MIIFYNRTGHCINYTKSFTVCQEENVNLSQQHTARIVDFQILDFPPFQVNVIEIETHFSGEISIFLISNGHDGRACAGDVHAVSIKRVGNIEYFSCMRDKSHSVRLMESVMGRSPQVLEFASQERSRKQSGSGKVVDGIFVRDLRGQTGS